MDRYLVEELNAKCFEICTIDINMPEMVSMVIDGYYRILEFARIGRKEGLLELDDAKEKLDKDEETSALFYKLISLVVDGTEPKIVRLIGVNRYAATNHMSYRGLLNLMYIRGALMIQGGDNEWIISEVLKSMMPDPVMEELIKRESTVSNEKNIEKEYTDILEGLFKNDIEIDEQGNIAINELSKCLIAISDNEVQKLLSEVDTSSLYLALKGLPGKAKERIFRNVSPRVAIMIDEGMSYLGPVRLKDVEENCLKIIMIVLKLLDGGEIINYDFLILKNVIDMYDL